MDIPNYHDNLVVTQLIHASRSHFLGEDDVASYQSQLIADWTHEIGLVTESAIARAFYQYINGNGDELQHILEMPVTDTESYLQCIRYILTADIYVDNKRLVDAIRNYRKGKLWLGKHGYDNEYRDLSDRIALLTSTTRSVDIRSRGVRRRRKIYSVNSCTGTRGTSKGAAIGGPCKQIVWFGTNRRPNPDGEGLFTSNISDSISYGYCNVYVPKTHAFAPRSFIGRLVQGMRGNRLTIDERLIFTSDDEYWGSMNAFYDALANPKDNASLVYIHGYNVGFEDAIIRAAQLGCDLKIPGATGCFSWPSKGNFFGYLADEENIALSMNAIKNYLVEFAEKSKSEKIHIIAHSMGNRGLLHSLHEVIKSAQAASPVRFGQVILAAPDVNVNDFQIIANSCTSLSDRTTLYASRKDIALLTSRLLHGVNRIGYAPPVTVTPGVDTIDVTKVNFDLLGHGYFSNAAELLYDIYSLISHGDPPDKRIRLKPQYTQGNEKYWML